jgi:hypothetical protein
MSQVEHNFPSLKKDGKRDIVRVWETMDSFTDAAYALPTELRQSYEHARDHDWDLGESYVSVAGKCRSGDRARVAPSDKFMSQFEDLLGYVGTKFETQNTITGGAPNVGAFLAGNPMNMRSRRRIESEQAPLNIVVDVVSSGGIDASVLEKRGAAILALVRILSAKRPVSLYIGAAGLPERDDNKLSSRAVAFKVDSAPLDLARAAHVICHPGVARKICLAQHTARAKDMLT